MPSRRDAHAASPRRPPAPAAIAPRRDLGEAVRVGIGLLLGLVLGWVVLVVVRAPGAAPAGREPSVDRATRRRITFGAGLVVVLFGHAMTGHPQATDPWVVHVAAQWVHVTVAAAWFGGQRCPAHDRRHDQRRHLAGERPAYLRKRLVVLSASTFPPVWQVGQ